MGFSQLSHCEKPGVSRTLTIRMNAEHVIEAL
jgi:hypothetical protein